MSKMWQEDILSYYFNRSLQLEDLLLKKYDLLKSKLKNNVLDQMVKELKKNSREHIRDLNDKMKVLGIQ